MKGLEDILLEERLVGYLDPGGERLLRSLNAAGWLATTSSCVGRVTVIEGEWPWERRSGTRIVFKSHVGVSPEALALIITRGFENLWLKVTGPILHARVEPSCIAAALEAARRAGFKHSGVISMGGRGEWPVVEFSAPTGFSAPLVARGRQLVVGEDIEVLAELAAGALEEGRRRLRALVGAIASAPCPPEAPGVGREGA